MNAYTVGAVYSAVKDANNSGDSFMIFIYVVMVAAWFLGHFYRRRHHIKD